MNRDLALLSSLTNLSSDEEIVRAIKLIQTKYPKDPYVAAELAKCLAASGEILSAPTGIVADIPSTGGPSSLSTLLGPLFLRVGGAIIPKLGVPGRPAGGIDCLAQIPGYRCIISRAELDSILSTAGYAHFIAEGDFAPLDGRMFKLRQLNNAQSTPTLVIASLLSKKLAVGVKYVGLDVRVAPYGNFGQDWAEAKENSQLFIQAAAMLSINATCILTNGIFPYQPFIGRSEALVALEDLFNQKASNWLTSHYELCRKLALSCLPNSKRFKIANADINSIMREFEVNLINQGTTITQFHEITNRTRVLHNREVVASNSGFVFYPLADLRACIVKWQLEYQIPYSAFSDPVGVILKFTPSTWVNKGDVIATVRAENEIIDEVHLEISRLLESTLPLPVSVDIEGVW